MLSDWDFTDEKENSVVQQVNRQKSAVNLDVISIDRVAKTGIFFDEKKDLENSASMTACDCRDFNYTGKNLRKTFKPCMHIYRLAMELGLLQIQYRDHASRRAETRAYVIERKREETIILQLLMPEKNQWGEWNHKVHESGVQKNRQFRAFKIKYEEPGSIRMKRGLLSRKKSWSIHKYSVTLQKCSCPDYMERNLPCKHIYAVAVELKIELPLTYDQFQETKGAGDDLVFRFETDRE